MFIVKCSWCNREISRASGPDGISHGICPLCYERTMREIKTFLPRNIILMDRSAARENTLAEHY